MALNPKKIPITRKQLHGWLKTWRTMSPQPTLRDYLTTKVSSLNLSDTDVSVAERDDFEESQIPLVDYIIMDIDSYV